MVKVAINGFGRIGRNVLRAIVEHKRSDIDVVAINDLAAPEISAHLLQYDSVHGRFPSEVALKGDEIHVDGKPIRITAMRNPADLPWSDVDVVMECTGVFRTREAVQPHLENGSSQMTSWFRTRLAQPTVWPRWSRRSTMPSVSSKAT